MPDPIISPAPLADKVSELQHELNLLPQHARLIAASGILLDVARERGYRSVTVKADLKRLGFADYQCRTPTLAIPIRNAGGEIISYQIRPDDPRIGDRGKPIKYETPSKAVMALDVPFRVITSGALAVPEHPLLITEGSRKADAAVTRGLCCVSLLGVWNWRGRNERGGLTALPDWELIALNGRDVFIAFDSDVTRKREVYAALVRIKRFLEGKGAHVHAVYLPTGEGGVKVGLDDYLAAGHSVDELLALARFVLPAPPEGEALKTAIRASLRMLDVASLGVTAAIYAAVWAAPLGVHDLAIHLSGATGGGKSELVALAQRHYGAGMDARNLPGAWSGTANSLEGLTFLAKDALLTIDDFCPRGSPQDIARLHRESDRLVRAAGNCAGRSRMAADGSLRPVKPPRALILSTGEEVPSGQSCQARMVIVEVGKGAIDWGRLTGCQRDATDGLYAQALASYLRWLAAGHDEMMARAKLDRESLAQEAVAKGQHARAPRAIASLGAGLQAFFRFAVESGVIEDVKARDLWARCWGALRDGAADQGMANVETDPARQFIDLLGAAVRAGMAHIATVEGNAPMERPDLWGWRPRADGSLEGRGPRVGWVAAEDLLIDPETAYEVARRQGAGDPDALAVRQRTLQKRLAEAGLLKTHDSARGRLTVRRMIGGRRLSLLHLAARAIHEVTGAPGPQTEWPNGPLSERDRPTSEPLQERDSEELGHLGQFSAHVGREAREKTVRGAEAAGEAGPPEDLGNQGEDRDDF